MREIGEQWIENGGMYKAVEGIPNFCIGCCWSDAYHCCGVEDCPTNHIKTGLIVRVLGPVNEDGLLPCPFCGEFPKGVSKGTEYKNDCEISIFYIEHSCKVIQTTEFTYSEQQSIDAWNRRV